MNFENLSEFKKNAIFEKFTKYEVLCGNYYLFGPVNFPMFVGGEMKQGSWYVWHRSKKEMVFKDFLEMLNDRGAELNFNSILTFGDFINAPSTMIRIHSCCMTGDIFQSARCDCGAQLQEAIKKIVTYGSGAIVYLSKQEGRGIGLFAKAIANELQDLGLDTYEANKILNFEEDERDFTEAGHVIKFLRQERPVTILSNNPDKIMQIKKCGVNIMHEERIYPSIHDYNIRYLSTKKRHGHLIDV